MQFPQLPLRAPVSRSNLGAIPRPSTAAQPPMHPSLRSLVVVLAQLPDGAHVLHRIVRIDGDVITLRGDANRSCDPPVPMERVLAVAEEVLLEGRPVALAAPTLLRSRLVVSDRLRGLATTLRPSSGRPDPAARRS